MEPEGSLPCSQEPSIGPYPEPDQSSPYHCIPSFLRSILIWLLVYFTHLHSALIGVSSSLYYKYLNTPDISGKLAIFRCTVWFHTVDL
jgi:hypothetical protein